eukprot:6123947-Pyramimonas_sp.AAC.1
MEPWPPPSSSGGRANSPPPCMAAQGGAADAPERARAGGPSANARARPARSREASPPPGAERS